MCCPWTDPKLPHGYQNVSLLFFSLYLDWYMYVFSWPINPLTTGPDCMHFFIFILKTIYIYIYCFYLLCILYIRTDWTLLAYVGLYQNVPAWRKNVTSRVQSQLYNDNRANEYQSPQPQQYSLSTEKHTVKSYRTDRYYGWQIRHRPNIWNT